MKWLLNNIHTFFLLLGIWLFVYGLFLFGQKVGFIGSGIILVLLAIYIDNTGVAS